MRRPISIDLPDVHLDGNQPWDVAAVEVQAELRGLVRAIDRALDGSRAGSTRSAA